MKILLATAHPYIPQISGGAQSSMHELACEFTRRGHTVGVLAGLTAAGWRGLTGRFTLKFTSTPFVTDFGLGYPVFRTWFPWEAAKAVHRKFAPDVVVAQSGLPVKVTNAFQDSGARLWIYLRNAEMSDLGGDLLSLRNVAFVANSRFTAAHFKHRFGINADIVYPLIKRENYETETTRENVTFINPHPLKGLDVALAVARSCPDIPFAFIEAWTLSESERSDLKREVASLPNVTLRSRTKDMKSVYSRARIVLAPSRWAEAFGRVAAEAQFSGIPVVGSQSGGLPEAIGPGGVVIDVESPIDVWVSAVRRLWDDDAYYLALSGEAAKYAGRADMNPEVQMERLLTIFESTPL